MTKIMHFDDLTGNASYMFKVHNEVRCGVLK